jgi:hypothetical protein
MRLWTRLFGTPHASQPIIIVSGLPRSGTSLMMQMLVAGGVEILTDALRQADVDNPKGYFEFEPVKHLQDDASWLDTAHGKAIKVIAGLLPDLPPDKRYAILFMLRPLEEVLASQRAMLQRRHATTTGPADAAMAAMFEHHLQQTQAWLRDQPHMDVLYVQHHTLLEQPREQAERIQCFLKREMAIERMVAVVDSTLYRHRA